MASIRAITRCESCAILSTGFRLLFAMAETCETLDSAGIRHSIEVPAEALYEAAALAVKEFRDGYRAGHSDAAGGQQQVSNGTHEVSVSQRENCLASTPKRRRESPVREPLGPRG